MGNHIQKNTLFNVFGNCVGNSIPLTLPMNFTKVFKPKINVEILIEVIFVVVIMEKYLRDTNLITLIFYLLCLLCDFLRLLKLEILKNLAVCSMAIIHD